MSYKSQLQTNNNTIVGNNTDLQSILNTINNLPTATESIDLDAEITAQDTVISQIQEALVNKSSNNLDTSDATATADDIAKDKTAYVDGVKIIGTHECSGGGSAGTATVTVFVNGGDSAQCFYYNNGQLYAQSVEGLLFDDAEESFTVDINSCFIIATPYGTPTGWVYLLEYNNSIYSYKVITEDTSV